MRGNLWWEEVKRDNGCLALCASDWYNGFTHAKAKDRESPKEKGRFRPALTPRCEGQNVHTGISLCLSLGEQTVIFVGLT